MTELEEYQINGIWEAIEEKIGLDSKDVAITEDSEGTIKADCSLLQKIPEPGLESLKEGYISKQKDTNVYIEVKRVTENNQLIVIVRDVK